MHTPHSAARQYLSFAGALLLSMALSIPLLGQVAGGAIQGFVSDPSGAAVTGAQVTVTEIATGVSRTVSTNSAGLYAIANLQPSIYTASITASGFSRENAENLSLTVGANLTVNFALKIGTSSEQVEVRDTANSIDLVTSNLSEVVDSTTIRELPLNGRDWSQLITLQPGADEVRNQSTIGGAGTSDVNRVLRGFGNQMSIAGTRPQQNNYRLDGVSFNDYTNGAPGGVLGNITGVDAVQ